MKADKREYRYAASQSVALTRNYSADLDQECQTKLRQVVVMWPSVWEGLCCSLLGFSSLKLWKMYVLHCISLLLGFGNCRIAEF